MSAKHMLSRKRTAPYVNPEAGADERLVPDEKLEAVFGRAEAAKILKKRRKARREEAKAGAEEGTSDTGDGGEESGGADGHGDGEGAAEGEAEAGEDEIE